MRPSGSIVNRKVAIILFLGTLFLFLATLAQASDYEKWDLLNRKTASTEYLGYKLSYSGLFTMFVWKNLADVVLFAQPEKGTFEGENSCEVVMKLSTENYAFAETFHPVRYQWSSTGSPDLRRTFLIETTDKGASDSHDVVWLDWKSGSFELYRKREKKSTRRSFWEDEATIEYFWEEDGKKGLPPFLTHYPKLEGDRSYLIHDKTINGIESDGVIDPLSMIYLIRQHDFEAHGDLVREVTMDDEIESYRARYLDKEVLNIGFSEVPTILVEVTNNDKNMAEQEQGWLKIWLTADAKRIPVMFKLEAPAGRMRVQITETSLIDNSGTGEVTSCLEYNPGLAVSSKPVKKQ